MRYLAILAVLLLSGCGTVPAPVVQIRYVQVNVPGPIVYCHVAPVEKPVDLVMKLKVTDDIHYKAKILLADREYNKAYILKMETAAYSCNQSK